MSAAVVLTTPEDLLMQSSRWRGDGERIGLVPTMGALHRGHRSLIERARGECDRVVVSIFVNPTQFGPGEDFSRYPRTLATDVDLSTAAGADVVFAPDVADIYPEGHATTVHIAGALTETLEGAARPGHFDGVCTVVLALLVMAQPDTVYFGAKDAQQCAVVRRMLRDLHLSAALCICPVVRDDDGLALSSRNAYLSAADRARALALPRAMGAVVAAFEAGQQDADALLGAGRQVLTAEPGMDIGYLAAVDPETFEPVTRCGLKTQIVGAARIGSTRLIDAIRLGVDPAPRAIGGGSTGEGEAVAIGDHGER